VVGNAWLQGVGVLVNKKLNRGFGVLNNKKILGLGQTCQSFLMLSMKLGERTRPTSCNGGDDMIYAYMYIYIIMFVAVIS
jgi:hypothetical protein